MKDTQAIDEVKCGVAKWKTTKIRLDNVDSRVVPRLTSCSFYCPAQVDPHDFQPGLGQGCQVTASPAACIHGNHPVRELRTNRFDEAGKILGVVIGICSPFVSEALDGLKQSGVVLRGLTDFL